MAKFSYDAYEASQSAAQADRQKSNGNYQNSVSFFSLKDDGEEAVVRFIYNDPSEFDVVTIHDVRIDNKLRRINCLRNPNESLENCPLCHRGDKVNTKFFIKLVQYLPNEKGELVPVPKVWERSPSFAKTLKSYYEDYGTLNDCIFKIKRHGVKGSTDTKYDILFANPQVYKPEVYVKDFSGFDGFSLNRYMVLDKSFEEMQTFVGTGSFPAKTTANATAPVSTPTHNVPVQTQMPNTQPSGVFTQPQNTYTNAYQNQVTHQAQETTTPRTPRRYTY